MKGNYLKFIILLSFYTLAIKSYSHSVIISVSRINYQDSIRFDARLSGKTVYFSWIVTMNKNNDHFEIESSKDGNFFTSHIIVKANSNENNDSVQYYYGSDDTPISGTSYYRLKQVLFNGDYIYSKVMEVNAPVKPSITISPNPNKHEFVVKANEGYFNDIIKIKDLSGNVLGTKMIQSRHILIDMKEFPSGEYYLEIYSISGKQVLKIKIRV